MRRIKLDKESAQIKRFILSLPLDTDGLILELEGEPLLRVLPVIEHELGVDEAKLKTAILRRRNESRRLNEEWQDADRSSFLSS